MKRSVSLTVNGAPVTMTADEATPLLYLLRNDLGLKGARFGCGEGLCGACPVVVDGRAIFSCDTPFSVVEGASVTTVEALAGPPTRDRLVESFVTEQAGQCGYCVPGMIMAAKALLDANPSPTRADVAAALERNLCRCGTHARILRAIERAAEVSA